MSRPTSPPPPLPLPGEETNPGVRPELPPLPTGFEAASAGRAPADGKGPRKVRVSPLLKTKLPFLPTLLVLLVLVCVGTWVGVVTPQRAALAALQEEDEALRAELERGRDYFARRRGEADAAALLEEVGSVLTTRTLAGLDDVQVEDFLRRTVGRVGLDETTLVLDWDKGAIMNDPDRAEARPDAAKLLAMPPTELKRRALTLQLPTSYAPFYTLLRRLERAPFLWEAAELELKLDNRAVTGRIALRYLHP